VGLEHTAERLYRRLRGALNERRRRRIAFRETDRRSEVPTVYFLAPDYDLPSGGTLVIYRHVDLLNSTGINAFAVHQTPNFSYTWFSNDTQVTSLDAVTLGPDDLLVVSELDIDLVSRLSSNIRYVIFNQNSHLTWNRPVADMAKYYCSGQNLAGVVTVSAHNRTMLRQAFGDIEIRRVHLGIDPALFHPKGADRGNRISYMPRRGHDDAKQLFALLGGREVLKDWELVPLDGISHASVAEQLRRTKIFLAFTHQEGFGLPAAEAMACGNYVIGNHGFGGREFFRSDFSAAVENGDIVGFATALTRALRGEQGDPDWCLKRGRAASAFVLKEYSVQRERNDVVRLYASLLRLRTSVYGLDRSSSQAASGILVTR
jgi:glycosyltransferase involved in cell wall biosynthesis